MCLLLYVFVRLVLPAESHSSSAVGRPRSPAVMRLSQSAASDAIPRLVRLPTSLSRFSHSSSSGSSNSAIVCTSSIPKHHSSLSLSASSSASSSGTVLNYDSTLLSTKSTPTQNWSMSSVSAPSLDSSGSRSVYEQSVRKHQAQPFRTQMILFQQKIDGATSATGQPHLLEITTNCAWEPIRPKVLARLSDLTKYSDGYPQTCAMSIEGFRVEVQPKSKRPTEIPPRLRESLGMSTMHAIRVRITAEGTSSVSLPHTPSAGVESSALRLANCNGVNVGTVCGLSVDCGTKQKTLLDVSRRSSDVAVTCHKLHTELAVHSSQERTVIDSGQRATTATDIRSLPRISTCWSQQSTTTDTSQRAAEVDSSLCKPTCCRGGTVTVNRPIAADCFETSAQESNDHFSDHFNGDVRSDLNSRINAASCVYYNNTENCGELQQDTEATAVIRTDVNSLSAKCNDAANSCLSADDGNFLPPADSGNLLSSVGRTLPAADCTEVECSLNADDGNFPSSPGLNVAMACPLDLRT